MQLNSKITNIKQRIKGLFEGIPGTFIVSLRLEQPLRFKSKAILFVTNGEYCSIAHWESETRCVTAITIGYMTKVTPQLGVALQENFGFLTSNRRRVGNKQKS